MAAARREYRFVPVDVFTERPFAGNPLAVLLDGQRLGDTDMQAIAREMNGAVSDIRVGGTIAPVLQGVLRS